jgi:dethiobiotin synthetase
MNGIFITGTDTGIGKTVLSALLLAELRRRDINAAPMKPVQTGCLAEGLSPGASGLAAPDLDYALSMASMTVSEEDYALMSPCRFEPACSPHLAAGMAGAAIDIADIVIAARKLTAEYSCLIAEGAGGILVPLNRRETMLDLMQAMRLPVLIAARPGLGTLNHTLLSIRALRSDGLDIAGVVFIAPTDDASGFIEEDNKTTIEHFGKVPVLGTVPYCAALADPGPRYDTLPRQIIEEAGNIVDRLGV